MFGTLLVLNYINTTVSDGNIWMGFLYWLGGVFCVHVFNFRRFVTHIHREQHMTATLANSVMALAVVKEGADKHKVVMEPDIEKIVDEFIKKEPLDHFVAAARKSLSQNT